MIAYTRNVPSAVVRCELTHLTRIAIDIETARHQHSLYEGALREAGVDVRRLPQRDDLPDSVFVEDTAVVLDEVAVITRPGACSRRDETETVRAALAEVREVVTIEEPATLDGGDVLVLGREVLVGLTPRSSISGMQQLRSLLARFGYEVRGIPVRGCLHLKTAITRAGEQTVVVNPSWIDPALVPGWDVVPVDVREPFASNVLWLGETMIVADAFERTNAALARATGTRLLPVPASELAKAEGGVTCCSLVLRES
jgi:dimethylargininase